MMDDCTQKTNEYGYMELDSTFEFAEGGQIRIYQASKMPWVVEFSDGEWCDYVTYEDAWDAVRGEIFEARQEIIMREKKLSEQIEFLEYAKNLVLLNADFEASNKPEGT